MNKKKGNEIFFMKKIDLQAISKEFGSCKFETTTLDHIKETLILICTRILIGMIIILLPGNKNKVTIY